MILTATQARHILAGRKTQLRVRVSEPRDTTRRNGTTYRAMPFRTGAGMRVGAPQAGVKIPISIARTVAGKRAAEPCCAVIVTGLEQQFLADVTYAAARAEGHRTTDEFKAWWVRTHDQHWVLRHETGTEQDGAPDRLTDEQLAARYDHRWGKVAVWALTFALDREPAPRYLAPAAREFDRDYTASPHQALPDELEAVDDAWLKIFATEAETGGMIRRTQVEDALLAERADLGRRLLNAKALARDRGVDVTSDLRVIERRVEAIESKIRSQHPNAA